MGTKYRRAHPQKWPGVYIYELARRTRGEADVCFVINYKTPDGKKRWEKVGLRSEGYTPQVAAELRAERVRKVRHGEEVKTAKELRAERLANDRTLADIAASYFGSRGIPLTGGKRTPDAYRWTKWLGPLLGKRRVSELTALDVQRVKRAMDGRADQTIKNTLELLRRLCNYGAAHGLCPTLGFTISMPTPDNIRTEFLSPEQTDRLVKTLNEWPRQDVARMVKVAMLTGMRRGEIFALQDADVDRRHAFITLRSPKGGRTCTIPLSAAVAKILEEQAAWRDERFPGSPYLFPGRGGRKRVDCSAVSRIKIAAGLPANFRPFHGLRHNLATHLASSGEFNLDQIGQLLTHKSTAMTARYAAFLPEAMHKASERAAALVLGVAEGAGKVVSIEGRKKG